MVRYGSHSAPLTRRNSMGTSFGGASLTWVGKAAPPSPTTPAVLHRRHHLLAASGPPSAAPCGAGAAGTSSAPPSMRTASAMLPSGCGHQSDRDTPPAAEAWIGDRDEAVGGRHLVPPLHPVARLHQAASPACRRADAGGAPPPPETASGGSGRSPSGAWSPAGARRGGTSRARRVLRASDRSCARRLTSPQLNGSARLTHFSRSFSFGFRGSRGG